MNVWMKYSGGSYMIPPPKWLQEKEFAQGTKYWEGRGIKYIEGWSGAHFEKCLLTPDEMQELGNFIRYIKYSRRAGP